LECSHHRCKTLIIGWVSGGKARHSEVTLRGNFTLAVGGQIRSISGLEIRNRQAHFLNQSSICLRSDDFQLNEDTLRSLDVVGFLHGIKEGARENFVYNSNTVNLVPKHVCEDKIPRGREKGLNNLGGSLGLDLLVDNPQNGERC